MVEEYESIVKNNVWEVVPRPTNISALGSRWTFKVKQAMNRSTEKYKAKFVAKGYSQVEEIDYEETFVPIASDEKLIRSCKEDLAREFEMKDMGLMHYFLGLEVLLGGESIILEEYIKWNFFNVGSTTVSWYNRKQRSVALSSVEVEYMVASQATCEAIWMRTILVGLLG
eukprot:PITA_31892